MSKEAAMFKETRTYDQVAKKHLCYQTAPCSWWPAMSHRMSAELFNHANQIVDRMKRNY